MEQSPIVLVLYVKRLRILNVNFLVFFYFVSIRDFLSVRTLVSWIVFVCSSRKDYVLIGTEIDLAPDLYRSTRIIQ